MIILQLKNSRKYINCNSLINYKDQGQRGKPLEIYLKRKTVLNCFIQES